MRHKFITLFVIAMCSTAALWCLDRAVHDADADSEQCRCAVRTFRATVGTNGYIEIDIPEITDINQLPAVQAYRSAGLLEQKWVPTEYDLEQPAVGFPGRITVYDAPGTPVFVVVTTGL